MERRVGFEICGAGTEDANGIYEPGVVPHYYGPPAWRKRGSSLFMFRWARTQWCLARLNLDEPDNGHIGDEWFLSNRLYVAPSGNPPCDEPPLRGWRPVRGASPAPSACREAYLPVLHAELPVEEVGAHLPLLRTRHTVAPACPVSDIELADSDLTLCGASLRDLQTLISLIGRVEGRTHPPVCAATHNPCLSALSAVPRSCARVSVRVRIFHPVFPTLPSLCLISLLCLR